MATETLTPGDHIFDTDNSAVAKLSYTVIPSTKVSAPLMVVCAVGWGPGRTYQTRGVAPLFTDYFTVITFSPRGSDESSPPMDAQGNPDPSKMSSTVMAEDLESLRIHLDIPSFPILMGHSNAGAIVLAYAEDYADKVDKVVIIGGQLLGYDGSATFKRFAAERREQAPWKKAYETWAHGKRSTDEEFQTFLTDVLPSYFVNPERDCPIVLEQMKGSPLRAWNSSGQGAADIEEQGVKIGKDDPFPEDENVLKMIRGLGKVKAKLLCSIGKEDMICPVEGAEMTVERINAAGGRAEIKVFQPCGHFPWIEKKDEFVDSTLKFLEV